MKQLLRIFAIVSLLGCVAPWAQAQTLKAAQAQKSVQAEAFLAYEAALLAGGLEAARPHMTPAKVADLQSLVQAFGDEGFKQFLERMRSGAQGQARRKQIEKVEVAGDHAVLEARDGPHAVTVQHLDKTRDGWKVGVKR